MPKNEIIITEEKASNEEEITTIFVHIDGAVLNPGIKEIEEGTRLFELIELAGGELESADLSRVNLSSVLKDEQKITIPYKMIQEEISTISSANSYTNSSQKTNSIININYANELELIKLNGIGTSMAKKIVAYREEVGYFNSIEEIKNVSGIGEAKFNKIKNDITV